MLIDEKLEFLVVLGGELGNLLGEGGFREKLGFFEIGELLL